MFGQQLENIRMKMTISKEYEELVLSVFYSPYANKYGSTCLVNRKFNFDVLNQYLYIIQSYDHTDDLILKIPGGIYTHQELTEIAFLIENANKISAM